VLQPLAAEVIEPDLGAGLAGVPGQAAAVIEEQLTAADLDVHRRQARQAGVKRAGARILRAAAFAEEDARQRLERFLALNQRILALLDGSDSPAYSMSTHGENGIAAAAVHHSRLDHHQQDSQEEHRQLTGSLIQGGRPSWCRDPVAG